MFLNEVFGVSYVYKLDPEVLGMLKFDIALNKYYMTQYMRSYNIMALTMHT